jgi:hypothetical protein
VVPSDVPVRASAAGRAWLAIAAAFVVGLLPSAYLANREHEAAASKSIALNALVHSHFLHGPFAALVPGAPHAKAIYARDGSWLYVVSDAPRALTVVAEPGERVLGTLEVAGGAASLYAATSARVATVELRDGAVTVERAILVR